MPKQTPPAYATGSPAGVELICRKTTIGAGGWEKKRRTMQKLEFGGGEVAYIGMPSPSHCNFVSFASAPWSSQPTGVKIRAFIVSAFTISFDKYFNKWTSKPAERTVIQRCNQSEVTVGLYKPLHRILSQDISIFL